MSRLLAPVSALFVFAACSAARPLYRSEPVPAPAEVDPVVGGKGFVSSKVRSIPSPLSLTASDGSGLELIAMSASAEIDDPVAVTHLELRFDNPKDQVVEGKLQLTLPPGASVTHFAMKIGARWQDAAVVERQAGRVAYEESLHRSRDPALLEKSSGNRFGVRVFPIAARGQVHLRVSYTQAFSEPSQPYRLALRGLPRVRNLEVRAGVLDPATGRRTWTKKQLERQRPTEDFVVARTGTATTAWRHGEHLLARVVVPAMQDVVVPTGSYTVLFDTSASRGVEFGLNRTLSFGEKTGRIRMNLAFRKGWLPERTTSLVSGIPGDGRTVFEGRFGDVQRLVAARQGEEAEALARRWQRESPDDLMALTALGRAAEARGNVALAARAYGSIAELHPASAPMLRFAAGRLQALGPRGLGLATDLLQEAQRQRPDHPSSHRSLAWVHVQRQQYGKAFEALVEGYDRDYPDGRFASAKAALADELSVVGAAWVRSEPDRQAEVTEKLMQLGLHVATEPSLRFVLTWETDANDVDLHIRDARGNEASYAVPALPSGGELLADVTNGFGPETFVIQGALGAYPYDLFVHYYARGPMGYGMGQVQTIFHDGKGALEVDTLPYVVMNDDAMLGVGSVAAR